jgi:hypothetical protein
MRIRPILVLTGVTLLAGCAYSNEPYGYSAPGYAAPNYYGYYQQPTYQPASQLRYQPAYRAGLYPFYSPNYPSQGGANSGG